MLQGRIKRPILRSIQVKRIIWDKFLSKLTNNFSEHPLTLWSLNGITSKLELKDLSTIIWVKTITYIGKMIEEFEK